jgi:hypothetical protein
LKDDDAGLGGGDTSTLLCLYVGGKSRYFLVGALTEGRIENKSCRYVMSSMPEPMAPEQARVRRYRIV